MKKPVVLYSSSAIVPIWMMILWPGTWIVVLPVSFVLNTIVLLLAAKVMKISPLGKFYGGHIVPVWMSSFLAYIIGGLLLFFGTHVEAPFMDYLNWVESITSLGSLSPYHNPVSILFIFLCIVVTILLIYLFNRYISFRQLEVSRRRKNLLALVFALVTGPYFLAAPSGWFF